MDVEYAFLNGGSHLLDAPCEALANDTVPADATVLKTELYDFTGRLLYSTSSSIPLNQLPTGLYILRMFTDNGEIVKKYMKY